MNILQLYACTCGYVEIKLYAAAKVRNKDSSAPTYMYPGNLDYSKGHCK